MAKYKTKHMCLRKFGWKRIAKNICRFGWTLRDAEENHETTVTHGYNVSEDDDYIYVNPTTTTTTKVRIYLDFVRYPDDFKNLKSIILLEAFYNLIFVLRRFCGWILPFFTVVALVLPGLGGAGSGSDMDALYGWYGGTVLFWLVGFFLEGILARIASKVLKYKDEE